LVLYLYKNIKTIIDIYNNNKYKEFEKFRLLINGITKYLLEKKKYDKLNDNIYKIYDKKKYFIINNNDKIFDKLNDESICCICYENINIIYLTSCCYYKYCNKCITLSYNDLKSDIIKCLMCKQKNILIPYINDNMIEYIKKSNDISLLKNIKKYIDKYGRVMVINKSNINNNIIKKILSLNYKYKIT
jgi:hypothetical protein